MEQEKEELLQSEIAQPAGKDEMNLAEFPFAVLSDRAEGVKTLQFSDTISGEDGKQIARRWTVTASDKFGMPTREDERVYVALMQLTKENGFDGPKQFFTRYRLLNIAGWPHTGTYYKRVESALDRLMGVVVKAENSFWDPASRAYSTESFHIIDNYRLYDHDADSKYRQAALPLSFFKWNEVIWKSIHNGYIKNLDTVFWFSLKGPITRRLHCYLDKKFYQSYFFKIEFRKLTLEHIGLARTSRPAKLKGFLSAACDELVARGYLDSYRYEDNQRGQQIVIFKRATRRRRVEVKPKVEQPPKLVAELVKRGVTESVAHELVSTYERKRIEEKIELYEFLKGRKSQLLGTNPAGYLRKAIEDDYRPPEGFQTRSQIAAMMQEQKREQQIQRWYETDRAYHEWAGLTDEEKAAGQLWMWRMRFKRQNQRDPKPEEMQEEKARIIEAQPTPEEYRRTLFAEAGLPDTRPTPKASAGGH